MKYTIALLAVITLVPFTGCRSSESYHRKGYDFYNIDKVAVVDVTGSVGGEAVKNQIADFFVMELVDKGYPAIGRSQVRAALQDEQLDPADVTLARNVEQAGDILDATVLFFVNIPEFEKEITIGAKIVDAEDASIIWIGTGRAKSSKSLATLTKDTTGAVVGVFSWNNDEDETEITPDPDQALLSRPAEDTIRRIVHDICKTIPKR